MFCKYCGTSQDDDALFCSACGKRIGSQTVLNNASALKHNPTINEFTMSNINKINFQDNSINDIVANVSNENFSVENDYSELDNDVEFTFDTFMEFWLNISSQVRLLLTIAAVIIIVLSALLMLYIFFPNINF